MQRFQGYFNRNLTPAVVQSAVLTVEDTDTFFGKSVGSRVGGSLEFGPHGEVHNDGNCASAAGTLEIGSSTLGPSVKCILVIECFCRWKTRNWFREFG